MSLFGDLDVESASDDPFAIPDNTYKCFVTEVKSGPTKDGSKVGLTLIYTISEGDHNGKQITEWKQIPQIANKKAPTAEESRALSFLKSRMLSLGIPAAKVNLVGPDDLIGIECYVQVKNNNGYTNVRKVTLAGGVADSTIDF